MQLQKSIQHSRYLGPIFVAEFLNINNFIHYIFFQKQIGIAYQVSRPEKTIQSVQQNI